MFKPKVITGISALLPPLLLGMMLLHGCASAPGVQLNTKHSSANRNDRVRLLVLHYTASNWQRSLQALTAPATDGSSGVSAHYLIPESFDSSYPAQTALQVYQLVPESQRAWHAGVSQWEDRQALNDQSIGIELVNQGWCHPRHHPGVVTAPDAKALSLKEQSLKELCLTPDFDPAQLQLLAGLLEDLLARYPDVSPTRVLAHSDIAPTRKQDPGARFPWQWLARQGIGAWYEDATLLKYWQALTALPDALTWQQALRRYGYGIETTGQWDAQTRSYTQAFQRHFVPDRISGDIDLPTVAVLWALLEKYFPDSLSGPDSLALPLQSPAGKK